MSPVFGPNRLFAATHSDARNGGEADGRRTRLA
jgi:hypothetical protein